MRAHSLLWGDVCVGGQDWGVREGEMVGDSCDDGDGRVLTLTCLPTLEAVETGAS